MHPVGTKAANKLGIYDMSGNASEWCYDFEDDFGTGELTNPVHDSSSRYRIVRGGDYSSIINYGYCKIFYRMDEDGSYGYGGRGLRIAQNYTE